MDTKKTVVSVLVLLFVFMSGCRDLQFDHPDKIPRETVYGSPESIADFIRSARTQLYCGFCTRGIYPNAALSVAAEENTSSWNNFGIQTVSGYPREPYPNEEDLGFSEAQPVESPWSSYYEAISLILRMENGLEDIASDEISAEQVEKFRTVGLYIKGVAYGVLSMLYDQGPIIPDQISRGGKEEFVPYTELKSHAIDLLEQAIERIENGQSFTFGNFIANRTVTSEQFRQFAHMYIARIIALTPRTPEENANADWQKVLNHLNETVTEDYSYEPQGFVWGWIGTNTLFTLNPGQVRAHYKTIGSADTTGRYDEWRSNDPTEREPFLIETADRRITGNTPTSDGMYFSYHDEQLPQEHRSSYYSHNRYQGQPTIPYIKIEEVNLLRAEALWHTDPQANRSEIVGLINQTRVNKGDLPPATTGHSDEELFNMIKYETHIELFSYSIPPGRAWLNKRGWGELYQGTLLHFPVPASDLAVDEREIYTHGGSVGDVAE